jgi:hypothetical protein
LEQLSRMLLLCRDHVAEELSDEELAGRFQLVRILCVSDERNLSTQSGQTALVTLVSLLSRMGMQVILSIPEVVMLKAQPPLSNAFLREALLASSETFVTGATVSSGHKADAVFVLGDTEIGSAESPCWRLSGSEWYGALTIEQFPTVPPWTCEWPVGAMVSAALGANEAFKFVVRGLPLRNDEQEIYFKPSRSCGWDFGWVPVSGESMDLGDVDFISAGAICQAVLFALLRIPNLQMRGRVFDDDVTGASNLNRNLLSFRADVGRLKVDIISSACNGRVQLEPVAKRFGEDSTGRLAQRVVVGVDDIPSRWQVQRHALGWVAVGGTSHFNVSSSSHHPAEPCAGCLHPIDDAVVNVIPTVSFVSFWAGLATAVRILREALGRPYDPTRQHLWITPLQMDETYAAMWFPVAPSDDCPVECAASRGLSRVFRQ